VGHLILSRRKGQSIIIGDNIKIKIKGFAVKYNTAEVILAIEAPTEIPVNRQELWEKKKEELNNEE